MLTRYEGTFQVPVRSMDYLQNMDKQPQTQVVGVDGSSAIWLVTEHGAQPIF